MRRIILSTFVFVCLPVVSHAQNYVPYNGYNGAGTIVNMDVLNGGSGSSSMNAPPYSRSSYAPPVMSQDLPAPVMLTPPSRMNSDSAPVANFRKRLGGMGDNATMAPPPITDEVVLPPALPSPMMGNVNGASPATANNDFEAYRLFFDTSSDVLKPSEAAVLNKIINKLSSDPALRLQVRAYADGTADNAGAARRLSLSRAMKVRDYLTYKKIAETRLDIRALGLGSAEMGDQIGSGKAPPDRVDLIFTK